MYFSSFLKQYNGNITGTIWRSSGDDKQRAFGYDYDNVNRLKTADFSQNVSAGVWDNTTDKTDFSVSNLTYDANGNILTMKQKALKLNSSDDVDDLAYNYLANTNRLNYVKDNKNDPNSLLGDFKEITSNTTQDYWYDDNGNMKLDNNKGISSITYNYLNLPQIITVTGKGTITYTYDAAGGKQKKVTIETPATTNGNRTITTTTTYLDGMVFESKTYSPVNPDIPNYTDVLQFMGHEEGRMRPTTPGQTDNMSYDYMVKDHLGNVRVVLTDELKKDAYPDLSFEGAGGSTEVKNQDAVWDNKSGQAINVVAVRTSRPQDFTTGTGSNAILVKRVTGTTPTAIGAAKLIKVMSGDKLNLSLDYYYMHGITNQNADGVHTFLNSLIAAITGSDAVGSLAKQSTTAILNAQTADLSVGQFFDSETPATGQNKPPKAYLHVLFFDERFVFDDQNSYVEQVQRAADPAVFTSMTITKAGLTAKKNGYAYIYFSNESDGDVYFDNLKLTHERSALIEETHYAPFGGTLAGISSRAANSLENNEKFNDGTEFNNDFDINLYETSFRSYDPQIGRFHQIDPLADDFENWSPYTFAYDNPIYWNDPLGLEGTSYNNWNDVFQEIFKQIEAGDLKTGNYYQASSGEVQFQSGIFSWNKESRMLTFRPNALWIQEPGMDEDGNSTGDRGHIMVYNTMKRYIPDEYMPYEESGWDYVPVVGSTLKAADEFKKGRWGWGLFYSAMAIGDVFAVKAAVTAVGKVTLKGAISLIS